MFFAYINIPGFLPRDPQFADGTPISDYPGFDRPRPQGFFLQFSFPHLFPHAHY